MFSSCPSSLFRIGLTTTAIVLLLLTAACSGGGGSSPTAPNTPPPANIAGSWTGSGGVESGEGYCTGDLVTGFRHDIDLEITQTGADIDVRWTNRPPIGSLTCHFDGSVAGNSFTLTPDFGRSQQGCGPEQDYLCGRRLVRRVHDVQESHAEGTVAGDRIEIRSAAVYDFYDKQTGQLLGEATYHGTTEVTRVR